MEEGINPFRYGGIVDEGDFCNRKRELRELRASIVNRDRVFVFGERRMGKTSLIMRVLAKLPVRGYLTAYVDLWPTDDATSFAKALAKSLSEAGATKAEKAFDSAQRLFANLKPALTLDQAGNPSLQFGSGEPSIPEPDLIDVLDAPQQIAEKRKATVVVVLDEFQRIAEYPDDRVERLLRSRIQHHKGVSYVFLGSRKHLIQSMFVDAGRPLYRSASHYPLASIAAADWTDFIVSRFESAGRKIGPDALERIMGVTGGHPFYTQRLAHELWDLTRAGETADAARVETALEILLERESYAYATLWDTLTLNQQRLLKGLAAAGVKPQPFSGEFAARHGLGVPSNVQSASRGLLDRDLIDRENGSLVIVDRLLRLWIERTFL